ncbi:Phosphatidylinositol N-acetylglucosaminyltransferase gpi3 subunit [Scheffersomyces spartinae]|uniref:Phosphatidylinositol N-acetylglucosaminyltransferase GPI3 subunit n=1 Tax=Scheffersomyces spartinae TaxID=45513 RepID=A0A9P7V9I2_9ASCO|nr:Phosphatidylinositol N-acetylglucosaminyltransferase gpi3 subunit [Scheffersomyces spartinae]KAG7193853.1 Phosphatidylinositol N-acetylglucosaminyltransferase gpi3 subunit [Scheffersomyces spartinae]
MVYNIAMVADFFYPQPGGVEFHVYHLAQELIDLGHSVVVITHEYGSRKGIRMLTNGLKVYYVPFFVLYRNSTFPTVFLAFPILRNIFIREEIEIVHGHGTYSSLCHEAIIHGGTMGLRTVFTDHSLFGFADIWSIIGNKILKFTLTDVGHVICVSNTCKENTVLRASLDPVNVSVIPNAVVAKDFTPIRKGIRKKSDPADITIVVISRLFANKGIDLLTAIIPRICVQKPKVRFLIAGDGPKSIELEQMREKYFLEERVQLVGAIKHEEVRNIMVQGEIYLHPSLTEAFGTVLVEAASCGLFVVTTNVGGIPEVLPNHMFTFAKPEEDSLVEATIKAITLMETEQIDVSTFHDEVIKMYTWENVARRTENVYNSLETTHSNTYFVDRLQKFYNTGVIAGKLYVLCVIVDVFIYVILEWLYPAEHIDTVTKWPRKKRPQYSNECEHHVDDNDNDDDDSGSMLSI